jgi:hypothetical protein
VSLLDAWLQTMRQHGGYGGPVSHWWESCLLYSGPKIDWRYEGILCGYVQLYQRTGNPCWLARACDAADDICRAQLPTGNFLNSSFQQGPIEGGTPHEAAVVVGLLELARLLHHHGDERWQRYMDIAERNIRAYLLGRLWNGNAFLDQPWNTTMVPNKNATTLEALLLYEELSGESMEEYITGAAQLVIGAQVTQPGMREGATIHLGTKAHQLAIPIYTARCLAALVRLYERWGERHYLLAAARMGQFLVRAVVSQGVIFGFYPNNRPIMAPCWLSPAGDVLRALLVLRPYTEVPETVIEHLQQVLLRQQLPNGAMPTAYGLGSKGSTRPVVGQPDFRDVLPAVGWCDKAFRALSLLVTADDLPEPHVAPPREFVVACSWKGQDCLYRETDLDMQLRLVRSGREIYWWRKNECYPRTYQL